MLPQGGPVSGAESAYAVACACMWRDGPPIAARIGSMLSLLNRVLALISWEAVITGGRIWTHSWQPWLAAVRCPGGGFAVAVGGRWEVTVSPA